MMPSPSNSAQSGIPDQLSSSSSKASAVFGIDAEQMFRLIDSILPFEACLYYQFVPLALEGRHLKLGMVTPHDSSALDYVRHILAYLNCSLKTEPIAADVHQAMLSAYLNHTHQSSSSQQQTPQNNRKVARSEQATLILDDAEVTDSGVCETSKDSQSGSSQNLEENTHQSPSVPTQTPQVANSSPREIAPTTAITPVPKVSAAVQTLPPLEVQARYLSRPFEFIATLAPQHLLQELLGRVLTSGIGRLYFERQPDQGRILWSQDGVLQCVLEKLPLPVFQGVIVELKRVVNLPLMPVIQPKQVEIERRYQQENLLLRLRVMPGNYGEEATLQVLRGAALKFYQRQHLEKLSQDALTLAQQLQRKLDEIRDRSYLYPTPLEALPELNHLLDRLDKQLEVLAELQIERHSDNSVS